MRGPSGPDSRFPKLSISGKKLSPANYLLGYLFVIFLLSFGLLSAGKSYLIKDCSGDNFFCVFHCFVELLEASWARFSISKTIDFGEKLSPPNYL
jgi:hypothetical protein